MNILASKSSGKLSSSQLVRSKATIVTNLLVRTNGGDDATVTLRNGQTGAAEAVLDMTVAGASNYGGMGFEHPLACPDGLYVTISGTGAYCYVYYQDPSLV